MTIYTYPTLSGPSASAGGSTTPVSINDKGQVTGFYFHNALSRRAQSRPKGTRRLSLSGARASQL
jgi:hypothetical protein